MKVRIVSFPSWDLFLEQSDEYKESVFPERIKKRIAVEAGVSMGWEKWVGDEGETISLDHFGASAPAEVLYEKFGFTEQNIIEKAFDLLGKKS